MNVLLVSQCDKRALVETRRILDQFAERRGDRTWQTPITHDGLDTLRRLLRKTARKNTAVACHWIRGLDHSELMWVVGDAGRFNAEGVVPTNTTMRNVRRARDENDWQTGTDIHLLSTLSALLHDLGKASLSFQQRLAGHGAMQRNLYRHEWVSLRLFQAYVGQDDDAGWLTRLSTPSAQDDNRWEDHLQRDGLDPDCDKPFSSLPPLAQAVGWLVLTHHRLPVKPVEPRGSAWLGKRLDALNPGDLTDVLNQVDAGWNEICTETDRHNIEPYWRFPRGLPVTNKAWRERAARVARQLLRLLQLPDKGDWLGNPYVMHVSRLALMLADHHYSSLTDPNDPQRVRGEPGYPLGANTRFDAQGRRVINQTLDEHLIGVARHSGELCHAMPRFEYQLPRLARHKGLKRRSDDSRFRWQDKAADTAAGMRASAAAGGAFIVNMASTGCGKTLANARVMYALADPQLGMRCSFALGLRTLTLQTGRVYRDDVRLGDDDLAIRVGGAASRELFEYQLAQAESGGSASALSLLDEGDDAGGVHFEGNTDGHPLLDKAMRDPSMRKLLAAPVLVCTIDHLTPATESQRGGRQIAPMLRLMSSDLVLDELDDFDIDDLPAVARLVHWAGLLGARVLVSSATLPPALVQGMFEAYLDGRSLYARNRGARPGESSAVACAWIDEFDQLRQDSANASTFARAHLGFVRQRHAQLAKGLVRRRAGLLPFTFAGKAGDLPIHAAQCIRQTIEILHQQHHGSDPVTGKRVSFGLVRMANIAPLVDVALALYRLGAPEGLRLHLCVYHARYPLLLRSAIERVLDQTLDRREEAAVYRLPEVRARLDSHVESDQVFVVLGSPVTEVGRDHDYDWAVVEPSSMRSLIQLAGRVWRHRPLRECTAPNLLVLDHNFRFWSQPDQPPYSRPGFETATERLPRRPLGELLRESEYATVDARPRILPQAALRRDASLVDLEHARLQDTMQPMPLVAVEAPPPIEGAGNRRSRRPLYAAGARHDLFSHHWWTLARQDALLTGVLQQQQPFRRVTGEDVDACLLPDDEVEQFHLALVPKDTAIRDRPAPYVAADRLLERVPDAEVVGERIAPWNTPDYLEQLAELAAAFDMPLGACAQRYGQVTLPANDRGWRFHSALGFTKRR